MSHSSDNMDLARLHDRAGISVKPLEWAEGKAEWWHAETVVGQYEVSLVLRKYRVLRDSFCLGWFDHFSAAKAAAQADYEQRIRSALSPTVSQPVTGEEVEWTEPPLTCPHIDAAIASGELSAEVAQELATIRDINSQLRYGTWALKARLSDYQELKAERDGLRELERAEQIACDAISALATPLTEGGERNAVIEECAKVADRFGCGVCGMDGKTGEAIRALKSGAPNA